MSLDYVHHVRSRYLRTHEEIFEYRRERNYLYSNLQSEKERHEDDLMSRQEERRQMLDLLIAQTQKGHEQLDPEKDRLLKKDSEQRWRILDNKRADDERREWNQKFRDGTLKARAAERERQRQKSEDRLREAERNLNARQVERDREARARHARNKARGGIKDSNDSDDEPVPKAVAAPRPPVRQVAGYSKSSVLNSMLSSDAPSSTSSYSARPSASSSSGSSRPSSSYSSRSRYTPSSRLGRTSSSLEASSPATPDTTDSAAVDETA